MIDLKIKYYCKAEACGWANRFPHDMTFGQFFDLFKERKISVEKSTDHSPDFEMDITSYAWNIKGTLAHGLILEDGTSLRTPNGPFRSLIQLEPLPSVSGGHTIQEWLDILEKACIAKEKAQH